MKRASAVMVLAASLAVAWLLSSANTSPALTRDDLPGLDQATIGQVQQEEGSRVLACYTLQRGDDPQTVVQLKTENFGNDLVRIRNLVFMCEGALKFNAPPQQAFTTPDFVLACYRIERGNDPADPYLLTTENFGVSFVEVRAAVLFCEGAQKTVTDADGTTKVVGEAGEGGMWQCFRTQTTFNPAAPKILLTDNFGRDEVRVGRATLICEDASKTHGVGGQVQFTIGQPTGRVLQCFDLTGGDDPRTVAKLETLNFGEDDVAIRGLQIMCEPATKGPVFTFQAHPVRGPETPTPTPVR
jgi:hypothetical protein